MELLQQGVPFWALGAYLIFMAAVQALPRPDEDSSKFYVWMYSFLHLLSINVKLAIDPRKHNHTQNHTQKKEKEAL